MELHPDKTKILHNQRQRRTRHTPDVAHVNDLRIEILPFTASQKYLGRKFTFDSPHDAEVDSRIAAGWRKFHAWKQKLTTRQYSLLGRLRLFHGAITPTILCTSWTMITKRRNRLRRAQTQMLRMILGSPRRQTMQTPSIPEHDVPNHTDPDDSDASSDAEDGPTPGTSYEEPTLEPWADWAQRTTHEAERHLSRLNIQDWNTTQQHRKEQWFNAIAEHPAKWTHQALHWDPTTTHQHARRRPGHPKARWTDDIERQTDAEHRSEQAIPATQTTTPTTATCSP